MSSIVKDKGEINVTSHEILINTEKKDNLIVERQIEQEIKKDKLKKETSMR